MVASTAFFVAPPQDAARYRRSQDIRQRFSMTRFMQKLDLTKLARLEAILTGSTSHLRSTNAIAETWSPHFIAGLELELAWIYVMPPDLLVALQPIAPRVSAVAVSWARVEECRRDGLDSSQLECILVELLEMLQHKKEGELLFLLIRA